MKEMMNQSNEDALKTPKVHAYNDFNLYHSLVANESEVQRTVLLS